MINNCINKTILQIVLVGGILAQTGQEPFADEKSEKVYYIQSILEAPLIDGILDDSLWSSISPITDFIQKNPVEDISGRSFKGMLDFEDFFEWNATIEEPESIDFRGLDVFKCPSWTQGPTFLQHLAILDTFDLEKIGHNSEEYLHILIESGKLAFADREA